MSRPQIDARFHSPMQLRFRDDLMLTRFAGLKVLHALFAILAFNRRLRHALRPCKSGRYRLWRIIKLLIVMIMLGGHRLRHFESMQRDPMLCRIIGVRQLPSVSTLSRYLSKAPQASATALRALNRQIIEDRLRSPQRCKEKWQQGGEVGRIKANGSPSDLFNMSLEAYPNLFRFCAASLRPYSSPAPNALAA